MSWYLSESEPYASHLAQALDARVSVDTPNKDEVSIKAPRVADTMFFQHQSLKAQADSKMLAHCMANHITSLPLELIQHALAYLAFEDILRVEFTSKFFHQLTKRSDGENLFPAATREEHITATVKFEAQHFRLARLKTCTSCGHLKALAVTGFDNDNFRDDKLDRTCIKCHVNRNSRYPSAYKVSTTWYFHCLGCKSMVEAGNAYLFLAMNKQDINRELCGRNEAEIVLTYLGVDTREWFLHSESICRRCFYRATKELGLLRTADKWNIRDPDMWRKAKALARRGETEAVKNLLAYY